MPFKYYNTIIEFKDKILKKKKNYGNGISNITGIVKKYFYKSCDISRN